MYMHGLAISSNLLSISLPLYRSKIQICGVLTQKATELEEISAISMEYCGNWNGNKWKGVTIAFSHCVFSGEVILALISAWPF